MLKAGVQTGYSGWYDYKNPEPGLKFLSECGFDAIDFNIDTYVSIEHLRKESLDSFFDKSEAELFEHFTPLKAACEKYGIAISQMHAPFPIWIKGEDDFNRYIFEVVEKCIAVCGYVGCPAIVVHSISCDNKDEEREVNMRLYTALIPAARKAGVKICLENLFKTFNGRIVEAACSDVEESVRYVDELNEKAGEELFGFCLDVGHATLLGRNMYRFITTLGKRLTLLHIHDNDGMGDHHMMPYTYTRNWGKFLVTDWEGFIKGLADAGFDGTLSFETFNVIRAFPAPLWPEVMRLLSATGRYWISRIEEIRAETSK